MWVYSLWLSWELLQQLEKRRRKRATERKGVTGPESSWHYESIFFSNQIQISWKGGDAVRKKWNFTMKTILFPAKHPVPSLSMGCSYFWQSTKKSPLICCCVSAVRASQHLGFRYLTCTHFLAPCKVLPCHPCNLNMAALRQQLLWDADSLFFGVSAVYHVGIRRGGKKTTKKLTNKWEGP